MTLDPHAKRFLDIVATAGPVDARRLSVDERRDSFSKLMSLSHRNMAIGRIEDRALPGPEAPVNIRLYTPVQKCSDRLPGIIYFHGGGLVAGSLDTHDNMCRTLANETGCRLISVDYRLAPEHKFPAGLMDGYAATIWAIEHAAELGIVSNRIALAGDSAGATLAAAICQMVSRAEGLKLAAQLLLCPVTDFSTGSESRSAFARGYLLDNTMIKRDLELYLPAGADAGDPLISPLRAPDLSRLPPAYIHTAEFDPLRDEGKAYAVKLAHADVKVRYTCHPGMIHLFYAMPNAIPYARTALKTIGAELKAALA